MRELYLMRHYPFAYAPVLIVVTLLLNAAVPLLKSKPASQQSSPQSFASSGQLLQ